MSPWLFSLYIDDAVREVNSTVQGRGVQLLGRGRNVCRVNQLLHKDDTILIGNSRENLQRLVSEFDNVCKGRKLKVNVGKIKVMVCGKTKKGFSFI